MVYSLWVFSGTSVTQNGVQSALFAHPILKQILVTICMENPFSKVFYPATSQRNFQFLLCFLFYLVIFVVVYILFVSLLLESFYLVFLSQSSSFFFKKVIVVSYESKVTLFFSLSLSPLICFVIVVWYFFFLFWHCLPRFQVYTRGEATLILAEQCKARRVIK